MPKVSISLDSETAEAISQRGKSLGEAVKEIVLEHARRMSRYKSAEVICAIVSDVLKKLESEDLEEVQAYYIIGEIEALIKSAEAIGLTPSEQAYIGDLWHILKTAAEGGKDGCRLKVVKTLLAVIGLYMASLLCCDGGEKR
jgi:hypothetical protein